MSFPPDLSDHRMCFFLNVLYVYDHCFPVLQESGSLVSVFLVPEMNFFLLLDFYPFVTSML